MSAEPDQARTRAEAEPAEVVDALPVLAQPSQLAPRGGAPVPARQAAALAATSFVAGCATAAIVHRRRARVSRRARRKARKNGVLGEIVGSNSFLIDVHLIRRG